jgi:hypothetical protein
MGEIVTRDNGHVPPVTDDRRIDRIFPPSAHRRIESPTPGSYNVQFGAARSGLPRLEMMGRPGLPFGRAEIAQDGAGREGIRLGDET